jgi:hypothetical protein
MGHTPGGSKASEYAPRRIASSTPRARSTTPQGARKGRPARVGLAASVSGSNDQGRAHPATRLVSARRPLIEGTLRVGEPPLPPGYRAVAAPQPAGRIIASMSSPAKHHRADGQGGHP